MVDPIYRELMYGTLDGGVKPTSNKTYVQNFLEFWRTMRRLGIPDYLVWTFPTSNTILQIYIINCAIVRPKINCWDTIRGKLRAIDYIAQLCEVHQSWSENNSLFALTKYCKKRNPGGGSDTLPVTADLVVKLVRYVLKTRVYHDLELTDWEERLSEKWCIFKKVYNDTKRVYWYCFAISILFVGILGLRGAECYENGHKEYEGYGVYLSDVKFMWRNDMDGSLYASNRDSIAYSKIDHMRIRLRHSKGALLNKHVWLRMGRTYEKIDPVIIIYRLMLLQRNEWKRKYNYTLKQRYLFQPLVGKFTLNIVKKKWFYILEEYGVFDFKRHRFHGLRKGFATTLQRKGCADSLIAFAGRWKLRAAIYRYIIHMQRDMNNLCKIYLYGKETNKMSLDLDANEIDLCTELKKNPINLDVLKAFEVSLSREE